MAKKSNKTAHVLNLLTTSEEQEEIRDSDRAVNRRGTDAVTQASPAPAQRSGRIRIETGTDNPVSDIVKDELERQFELSPSGEKNFTSGAELISPERKKEEMHLMSDQNKNINSLNPMDEYVAVNIVEDVIKSKAYGFMERLGGCVCYRCVNDVIALALNSLPPQYTVTLKGMLFAKVASYENQHTADIAAALTKSCLTVKGRPRH